MAGSELAVETAYKSLREDEMIPDPEPPRWAERLLQAFLTSGAFESVSGDLLEEYRDTVFPTRGAQGTNV